VAVTPRGAEGYDLAGGVRLGVAPVVVGELKGSPLGLWMRAWWWRCERGCGRGRGEGGSARETGRRRQADR